MNIYEPKNRMMTRKLFQVKRTELHGQVLIGEEEEEEEEEEEDKEEKEEEEEDDDDDEEPLQVKPSVKPLTPSEVCYRAPSFLSFALLVRPEALHGPREGRAVDRDE